MTNRIGQMVLRHAILDAPLHEPGQQRSPLHCAVAVPLTLPRRPFDWSGVGAGLVSMVTRPSCSGGQGNSPTMKTPPDARIPKPPPSMPCDAAWVWEAKPNIKPARHPVVTCPYCPRCTHSAPVSNAEALMKSVCCAMLKGSCTTAMFRSPSAIPVLMLSWDPTLS